MKTILYWFSGTGNSLAVAKTLAARLEDATCVPIRDALRTPPSSADRIGLVFPVYGWGPPRIVERFVRRLELQPHIPVFAVATYAGTPGGTLDVLRRVLQGRGLDLTAGWGVKMPENYPPLGGAPVPEKQQEINQSAAEKMDQIAAALQAASAGPPEKSPRILRLLSRAVHPLFRRFVPRADRFFRVESSCDGCGLCAAVCPVADIRLQDGRPVWLGHCEQCFACFHWCPRQAIQYGRSANQHRYHHPEAQLSDLVGAQS